MGEAPIPDEIYERLYRRMHPKRFPYSPWERQRELHDLWPVDQRAFRQVVDAVLTDLEQSDD